jgi:two-component system KDP operon response regulator KdpE
MHILVIDSELPTRRLLRTCLELSGYEVVEAASGIEGIDELIRTRPGAVLMELELPDIDGLIVLKQLREWSQIPVLVVSTRAREDDKISALDSGANDYIAKPFSTGELLARMRVAHRLTPPLAEEPTICSFGGLQVNLVAQTVLFKGEKLELSSIEYSLLALFMKHTGKVLTHGFLLREIWGTTDAAKMGRLRMCMSHLREKLEPDPAESELSLSETGIGYRLVFRERRPNCFRREFASARRSEERCR